MLHDLKQESKEDFADLLDVSLRLFTATLSSLRNTRWLVTTIDDKVLKVEVGGEKETKPLAMYEFPQPVLWEGP